MKRKTAAFCFSLALALSLAACGGETGPSNGSSQPQISAPQTPSQGASAQPEGSEWNGTTTGSTLVVYFSATGNTQRVADQIAQRTGGDLFELEPVEPYTQEDLNYGDNDSRAAREYADASRRDVELVADTVENWDDYDTVFLGYPIWWGEAAWPVNGFVEANDFTGKTVIPFCTSASSGLGSSAQELAELAGAGDWQEGMRFSTQAGQDEVQAWLDSLAAELVLTGPGEDG